MSNFFTVIEIIDAKTIKVSPSWQLNLKDGEVFMGDRVNIRGLDQDNDALVKNRLQKLLVDVQTEINFKSPELINSDDPKNALVSCSVYLGKTNILYYFPEYVHSI